MKSKQKRIMLVDDYKDVRDLYAQFLSMKGFDVSVASSGQEALRKTFELSPDLIVMDYSLPDIGGWDVTQRLKKDPKTRQIPILLLTAYDFVGVAPVFREQCAGVLIKPCMPDKLFAEITEALERTDRQLKTEEKGQPNGQVKRAAKGDVNTSIRVKRPKSTSTAANPQSGGDR